jgi:hypothetical protein
LVENWILPNRSETTELGKKTEGILGVKHGVDGVLGLMLLLFLFPHQLAVIGANCKFI